MVMPSCDVTKNTCIDEVCLRIPVVKLMPLLLSGDLHAEDFRCLDPHSKTLVRRLLLSACRCQFAAFATAMDQPGGHAVKRNNHEHQSFAEKSSAFLPG